MKIAKFILLILPILFSFCKYPNSKNQNSQNTDTLKIKATQGNDTSEIEFYKSLLDSFMFYNYKIDSIYTGNIAKLDLTYFKETPKDIIENIFYQYNTQKQPNFAGHYIIVTWGCGSPCQMNAIIDAITGKTIESINTSLGLDYNVNSYLLVANPPADEKYRNISRDLVGNPKIFEFKNNKLTRLK